eukprot:m.20488 g.20488  ORF g.20488 m.20488 type:complete len:52 (-) comp5575_c0_seq2:374-529(-)
MSAQYMTSNNALNAMSQLVGPEKLGSDVLGYHVGCRRRERTNAIATAGKRA